MTVVFKRFWYKCISGISMHDDKECKGPKWWRIHDQKEGHRDSKAKATQRHRSKAKNELMNYTTHSQSFVINEKKNRLHVSLKSYC